MGEIDPRGIQLFIADIVFLALTWLFVSLRAFVAFVILRNVSLDDILMFASILVYTAHNIISVWGIVYASHAGQTDLHEAESIALYSWYLCEVLYTPLSALIRTSIALFLLRIATVKLHRYIIYSTIVIMWTLSVPLFFILIFQCNPPAHFYQQVLESDAGGTCLDSDLVPRATIAHSVISAMMDFTLAFLPIAILWDVRLSKRTKAGVAALLGMGLFAGIALIVRIPYVKFTPVSSSEFLTQTIDAALWSILEASFGIIAGCAATLGPLATSFPSSRRTSSNQDMARRRSSFHEHNSKKGQAGDGGGSGGSGEHGTRKRGRASSHPTSLSTEDSFVFPESHHGLDSGPKFAHNMQMRMMQSRHHHGHSGHTADSPPSTGKLSARSLGNLRERAAEQGLPGGALNTPVSVVRVETSIEVRRESQAEILIGALSMAQPGVRMFPLQGGRVVTINGPVSQGLSAHTY